MRFSYAQEQGGRRGRVGQDMCQQCQLAYSPEASGGNIQLSVIQAKKLDYFFSGHGPGFEAPLMNESVRELVHGRARNQSFLASGMGLCEFLHGNRSIKQGQFASTNPEQSRERLLVVDEAMSPQQGSSFLLQGQLNGLLPPASLLAWCFHPTRSFRYSHYTCCL